MSPNKVNDADI